MHVREMRQNSVSELDKYIILDTQGGHEDVIALVAALNLAAQNDRIVLGITCVAGKRNLEKCVRDALIAQQIAGSWVPVFKGSTKSILLKEKYPERIDQSSDYKVLDQFVLDQKFNQLVQTQSAASFIAASIKQHKDQLCVITFGPLTNFALAFHFSQCNSSHHQISSIRINGGSYLGVGNVVGSSGAQANFYYDPQAAHIIITVTLLLSQNYVNVYVNPIERTLQTSLKQEVTELLETQPKIKNNKGLIGLLSWLRSRQFSVCGPLLTLLPVFNRFISSRVLNVYSQVIRSGNNSAGLMAPNWLRLQVNVNEQIPNTKIYTQTDRKILAKLLRQAFD